MKQTDAQLVKEALEGDVASFGVLVRKYQGIVYGLAYYMVRNFEDAEDLAQEAFLQAYLELHQLRDPSRFAGWLRRITCNTCNMWLRLHSTDHVSLDAIKAGSGTEPMSTDPAWEVERAELCEAVLKAINSLSEKNRLAVTLFYMDGLSYRQISNFLEVPVTTIESRLHKARKQLKKEMMQMIEQDFGRKKLGPEFATKVVEGTLELVTCAVHGPGYGFIRQGILGKYREYGTYVPGKDDIYVSPSQTRLFALKTGDVVRVEARPPDRDKDEHYYAMLYIHTVNDENPRKTARVVKQDFSMYTMETLRGYASGALCPEDNRSVQKHITECRFCRRIVEILTMDRMSSDQRVLYFLYRYDGMGIGQLAQVFDQSMGRIKTRLHHLMLQMGHAVEGTLEVLESGDGIVQSGDSEEEGTFGIRVSSEKISSLGLKTGDVVKGKARLTSRHNEYYYEAIGTFTVSSADTKK